MAGGAAPHGAIPAETDPPDSVGGASTPLPASLLPIPLEPASTPPHTGAGPTTPAGGAAGEGRRREKGDEQSKEGNGTPGERARHLAPYEYSGQTVRGELWRCVCCETRACAAPDGVWIRSTTSCCCSVGAGCLFWGASRMDGSRSAQSLAWPPPGPLQRCSQTKVTCSE